MEAVVLWGLCRLFLLLLFLRSCGLALLERLLLGLLSLLRRLVGFIRVVLLGVLAFH